MVDGLAAPADPAARSNTPCCQHTREHAGAT
jgi:hypothetical protein